MEFGASEDSELHIFIFQVHSGKRRTDEDVVSCLPRIVFWSNDFYQYQVHICTKLVKLSCQRSVNFEMSFGIFNSPKKQTKKFDFTISQIVFVPFWEN